MAAGGEDAGVLRRALRRGRRGLRPAATRAGERAGLAPLARQLALERELAGVERELAAERAARARDANRAWELLDVHALRIGRLERQVRIATVMAWIEQASLARPPLVSVVLPTRERSELLPRAIDSVLAQTHREWELLVCEDGADPATAAYLETLDDPRVRHLPAPQTGVGAARNRGLDAAHGELVAYLDDDNRMHRNWLKSVAWAFEQRPRTDALYGAIVIDDTARHHHGEPGEMPSAWLEPFDREALARANLADSSAIAHRAGLPAARWDEELRTLGDWDLLVRLAAGADPLVLPAIACFYHSDAGDRLSDHDRGPTDDRRTVLERARALRDARP